MSNNYHVPALLQQCIDGLNIQPDGIYVDVTFGGGGHSREILKNLTSGKLIGFDQDSDAHKNALDDERFTLIKQNFKFLKNNLRFIKSLPVNGILADLGVSSHQFDDGERGFSIRFDGKLDLRMDTNRGVSGTEFLDTIDERELNNILRIYGELENHWRVTQAIIKYRNEQKIETTFQLKESVQHLAPRGKENKFYAKLFQALRIVINDELGTLKELLEQTVDVLAPGGRLVVISYNSLEDRLVKNFIKSGNFECKIEKDFYGNVLTPLKAVNRKVIIPSDEEIELNNRVRSAKLRIAEKIA